MRRASRNRRGNRPASVATLDMLIYRRGLLSHGVAIQVSRAFGKKYKKCC
jgi:hypothetical protein